MAKRRPPTVHGLMIVDKPAGMTSHDVVAQLRRRLGEKRIGHAGTLDPDATGVLIIGVGMATRLLQFLQGQSKVYTGQVVFGTATATLDSAGETTGSWDMTTLTPAVVQAAIAEHLTGPILQVPPMVSALKIDGKRLHELAREGIEVERAPRPVTIHRFESRPTADPLVYDIDVECSSGTYIRSLAADLGTLLGGGAHLRGLRRRSIGLFDESESGPIDTCPLLPVATAVRGYTQINVDNATADLVRTGRVMTAFEGPSPWAIIDPHGAVLAMYEPFKGHLAKPLVVLVGEEPR